MDEQALISRAAGSLRETLGVSVEYDSANAEGSWRPDAHLTVSVGRSAYTFRVEAKRSLNVATAASAAEQAGYPDDLLVVSERITGAVAAALRERGVSYLDAAGNAHIDRPPLFVHVSGRPPVRVEDNVPVRAFSGEGLKAVFVLLLDASLASVSYRELAELAGVSHGVVQYTFKDLERSGYVTRLARSRRKLTDVGGLLDRWAAGHAETMLPKISEGRFTLTGQSDADLVRNWSSVTLPEADLWGGEPAAALATRHLRPARLTVYTREDRVGLMKHLRAAPTPDGPLTVLRAFWPRETEDRISGAFDGRAVPDVLTYADLVATHDPRNAEVAAILRERYLLRGGHG